MQQLINDTITIYTPSEWVRQVLSDVERWNDWNPFVSMVVLNGEEDAPITFDWQYNHQYIHSIIRDFKPGSLLSWQNVNLFLTTRYYWQLQPVGSKTHLNLTISAGGLYNRLQKKKVLAAARADCLLWLRSLRNHCEERNYKVCKMRHMVDTQGA